MTLLHPSGPPPHTEQTMTLTMTEDKEVPEMTLTALLDADTFIQARGDGAATCQIPCQQEDPELWFAEAPDDVEFAKALCGTCPVQAACLAGAVARREPWGVWGGELFLAGAVVARKRPRGRPRKDAAEVHARALRAAEESALEVLAARAS